MLNETEPSSSVVLQAVQTSVDRSYPKLSVEKRDERIQGVVQKAMGYFRHFGNSPNGPVRILFRFEYPVNPNKEIFCFFDAVVMGASKVLQCSARFANASAEIERLMFLEESASSIPKEVTLFGITFVLSDELLMGVEGKRGENHKIELGALMRALRKKKKSLKRQIRSKTEFDYYFQDSQGRILNLVIMNPSGKNPILHTAYYVIHSFLKMRLGLHTEIAYQAWLNSIPKIK